MPSQEDARDSQRTSVLNGDGWIPFFVGAILGQILFSLMVGVPGLVGLFVADQLGVDDSGTVAVFLFVCALGAIASGFIGSALGRRNDVAPRLVWGMVVLPLLLGLRLLAGPTDAFGLAALGVYVLAAGALGTGFLIGRRARGATAVG